ncbi:MULTISPECIES: hypothetical protein [unclassified Dysgonomonas]|uniref:hypothetical protein n=1 Tax=unclassified Dysgonomonas TaxID=2630389 RepID=UPI0025BBEF07|nr:MULTISPECIES: hypothetical protein [unclassified Dysgonomonas]HMM02015.1 hypothetical protein [Dysgonomonas sp.]
MKMKKILNSIAEAIISSIILLSAFAIIVCIIYLTPNPIGVLILIILLVVAGVIRSYNRVENNESIGTNDILYLQEDEIPVRAYKICEFQTFYSWVNHASSWLGSYNKGEIICVDRYGYQCYIGAQFQFAHDHDLFPVTAYVFIKNTEVNKPKQQQ